MTQEDKQLLLKDLSARLPYGVMFSAFGKDEELKELSKVIASINGGTLNDKYALQYCKPYLRPMSSMTEEEKEEMHNLLSPKGTAVYKNDGIVLPVNHYGEYVTYEFMNRIIQCLLENHFDFMGLIPKGLAIEVNEINNPYK